MSSSNGLTTARILEAFTGGIAARGGEVTDTFDDSRRLFVRSVFPATDEVRSGDRMRGGVALRATENEVRVHPYLFRLVCRNGAIMVHTLGTLCVDDLAVREPEETLDLVVDAVAKCSDEAVFRDSVRRTRRGSQVEADVAIGTLTMLTTHLRHADPRFLATVMEQFFKEGDRSQYGLANAVTAVARDTRDPALRWDLEELGGAILIGALPTAPRAKAATARRVHASVG